MFPVILPSAGPGQTKMDPECDMKVRESKPEAVLYPCFLIVDFYILLSCAITCLKKGLSHVQGPERTGLGRHHRQTLRV